MIGKLVKAHVPLSNLVDILDRPRRSVSIWKGLLVPCMNYQITGVGAVVTYVETGS